LGACHNLVAGYDATGLYVRLGRSEVGLDLIKGRQGRLFGLFAHSSMILGIAVAVIKDRRRHGVDSAGQNGTDDENFDEIRGTPETP
jgi:hypothetical protein